MASPNFIEKDGKLFIELHVVPGSKKTQISGLHDNRLKLKISSPPVDGKANAEIVAFFSELFEIPKRNIEIVKGELGRSKTVAIAGLRAEDCRTKLGL